jgi:glycosyltransferase involved in cell wall biosynthesis
MSSSVFAELPFPPEGKTGWPWTNENIDLPELVDDGTAWPKISVVTPSFNQCQFIEETIRSVLLQGYPNLEFIIIDGASTDFSVEVIKKYEQFVTYWVSAPDEGQADAIAKGLDRTTGEIECYLNSDDVLLPDSLRTVARKFVELKDITWVCGACNTFSDDISRPDSVWVPRSFKMPLFIFGIPAAQQSTFWKRTARQMVGFDTTYHFCMDIAFFSRLLDAYGPPLIVDEVLAGFRWQAQSKSSNQQKVWAGDLDRIARYWLHRYSFRRRIWLKHVWKTWKVRTAFSSYLLGTPLFGEPVGRRQLLRVIASYPLGLLNRQCAGAVRRFLLKINSAKQS